MRNILLTLDYELYGNGSGDVFKHIIEPTERILNICQTFHAKLTIFFEVVEYWKLKEEWEKGNKMGYEQDPILAMEKQLQEAYLNGHDIQLHLHPQWIDAKWLNGEWIVNNEDWRLGGFRNNNYEAVYNLINKGKKTIESIIWTVDSNYNCSILRAGGYNIQPSDGIVKAMKALGMKADWCIDTNVYVHNMSHSPAIIPHLCCILQYDLSPVFSLYLEPTVSLLMTAPGPNGIYTYRDSNRLYYSTSLGFRININ